MEEETLKARERRVARLREKHPDVDLDNEDEIADAAQAATIAGRNEAIELKKKNKPQEVAPTIGSKATTIKEEPAPSMGRSTLSAIAKKRTF